MTGITRILYRISRFIHKYLGLVIILFLIWTTLSGIILNHKQLFSPINIPSFMVPEQYRYENWNRGSMIRFLFMESDPDIGYVAGKRGIFKTRDGGKTFQSFMKGYPHSLLYRKTNDMIHYQHNGQQGLLAGNHQGLYYCKLSSDQWLRIRFSNNAIDNVLKLIIQEKSLLVITDSDIYRTRITDPSQFQFSRLPIRKPENRSMSMVDYIRHIHSGSVWGTVGKLMFDLLGLIIIFLAISAFYIWYFPKRRRKGKKDSDQKNGKDAFVFHLKYHKKLGILFGGFIILIAITAFFMRPPFIALIANSHISKSLYPSIGKQNTWQQKIHNAICVDNQLILETTEGFFKAQLGKDLEFKTMEFPVNVFIMGATVFEPIQQGILIGSFNGIYAVNNNGMVIDYMSKIKPRYTLSFKPGKYMVTGYFKIPSGEEFITTHRKGVLHLDGTPANERFPMPQYLAKDKGMSLWNYMFELHNGRIFKDLLGNLYILIIPLFSMLLLLVTLSGIIDWFLVRQKKTG